MAINEKPNKWLNRIVALLVGGLFVLIVQNIGVVAPLKAQNAVLTTQLDEIQNGAPRLLAEAKDLVERKDYEGALKALDTLFVQQPISEQIAEGKKLYAVVETSIKQKDLKWNAAVAGLRATWERVMASDLRAQMDKDMVDVLNRKWEESKDAIRKDWEIKQM